MAEDRDAQGWRCSDCGDDHVGLAMCFGPAAPDVWASADDDQRAGGELNADMCVFSDPDGGRHHFLRGHIEIPISDSPGEVFAWSAWVSLSEDSMQATLTHWEDPGRARLPPMFGWLTNTLPYDESTLHLPTHVHTRAVGMAPLIQIDPALPHPLAIEQRHGITMHRVAEINTGLLH